MSTTLPEPFAVNGRYEITERPLGESGRMGVIYKAYDVVTKRFVALKTIWADSSPGTIELFEREWTVLARLSHPNIVDILDTGDWVFNGERRPYFVMPLLSGRTLEEVIHKSSERLSIERIIDIISQACRGLQAAHDQNLIHRDIKPSNIFVMDDDTVKIIDFGVVYLADGSRAATSMRGTPLYMAPEQLEMKAATALSDIYSLAVVCYETLTGRQPFARETPAEIAEAVRNYVPPPASDLNPAVNSPMSRTVHKAIAKQPWHRFPTAREFGDTLQRALRNEPIDRFERSKILPRIERVKKAFGDDDYQFALEILRELESEGHVDPDMSALHIQIEQALHQKNVRQLLDNAHVRMEEEEYPLALHKVEDVLEVDPANKEALSLKKQIEQRRDETQLSHWFKLVREHIDNNLFGPARQGLQEILKIDSSNTEAREMLAGIDQTEQEIARNREEKQRLYENAVEAYRLGEPGTALTQLERALTLARRSSRSYTPDLDSQCQSFHDSIRDEQDNAQNAYQAGRNHLLNRNFAEALAICEEYLAKHPDDPRFQALKLETEEAQRHEQSAAIADVGRRVDAEPDLDKKHKILQDAVAAYPDEFHFRSALKLISDRRELVNSIAARARQYEERNQFADACGQLEILKNIYPVFPGLDAEIERLKGRRSEQTQAESRARWLEQIDNHWNAAEYDKAFAAAEEALAAFPGDAGLLQRRTTAEEGVARNAQVNELLKQGQDLCSGQDYQEGLTALRKAGQLDPRNRLARAALLSGLVSYARSLLPADWHAAEPLVKEALDLEPTDPVARGLLAVLDGNRRQSAINIILAGAKNYQSDGHLADALQIIERGLVQYPNDHRLIQLYTALRTKAGQSQASVPPAPLSAPDVEPASDLLAVTVEAPQPAIVDKSAVEPQTDRPVPHQNFFAPPTTDIPRREPVEPESDFGASPATGPNAAPKTTPRPAAPPRVPPVQPHYPRDPGLLGELSIKGPVWVIAALGAVALILSAGVYQLLHKDSAAVGAIATPDARIHPNSKDAKAARRYRVNLAANVDGTHFNEGNETLASIAQLAAGKHTVDASHDGFLPETRTFVIDPGASEATTVNFDLRPILPALRLNSSLANGGRLVVDDKDSIDLQAGVAAKDDLTLGAHTVKIYDSSRLVFSFAFETEANELPVLTSPLGTQPVSGVVVSSLLGTAKVYATPGFRASAALPVMPVPLTGLDIPGSATNPAHIFLNSGKGKEAQEQVVDSSVFPTLNIQLSGATQAPFLAITTTAANCQIFIDGRPIKSAGQSPSVALQTGHHSVRLSCPGYEDLEKDALVKAGQVTPPKLDFVMLPTPATVPQPAKAQFVLAGAPPDATVFQNRVPIGTVGPDGTFARDIDPGIFTWEWRKPGFEPGKASRTVTAGEVVRLNGTLNPSTGSLIVKVSPDNASLAVHRDSDNTPYSALNNIAVALPPGSYHVTAEAPDYRAKTEAVVVAADKTSPLSLDLEKMPVVSGPVRYFDNGDAWKPFSTLPGWWIHPGTGYSSLRASTGSVQIDFLRQKHFHKISLLADCVSLSDCIAYTLDAHNLSTKVESGGVTKFDEKKPHGMDSAASFRLIFEMSPDAIVVKNQAGAVLSSVERQNPRGKLSVQNETPLHIN